jgi:hypothetical protein
MEFEMKNGVLVPKETPQPICVFIDESYLLNQTGFLQAAVAVPQHIYTQQLVPRCEHLLSELGHDAKEFKGSSLKPGNAGVYREFLAGFINVAAHVATHAELFSIIAIDATDVYSGARYDWIFNSVRGVLSHLNITDEDHLVAEFSRQLLWLYIHYKSIMPELFANELLLCFDNKHRYAQRMQALRAVYNEKIIAPTFWQLGKAFPSFANRLMQHMEARLPPIARFDFLWSSAEFGLQAADLLCHLTYDAIKHEMGIVDDNTALKTRILREAIPSFALDPKLRTSFAVSKDHQGREDIHCTDPKLRSRIQLRAS